jgi:hypothetical protein
LFCHATTRCLARGECMVTAFGCLRRNLLKVCFGSIATGRGKLQVQPCPQCPVSDGRPEKGGLS